ncbi:putative receptor-like protein kinase [Ananas comosus]|nr:putative receptor-like protein kinase [Ananas comosus]
MSSTELKYQGFQIFFKSHDILNVAATESRSKKALPEKPVDTTHGILDNNLANIINQGELYRVVMQFQLYHLLVHTLKQKKVIIIDVINSFNECSFIINAEVFIGIGSGLFVCLCLIVFVLKWKKSRDFLFCWKKKSKTSLCVESFIQKYGSLNTKRYKYSEVKRMTKSFTDKLGKGGYGTVYKGSLPNGHPVAVKMLTESKGNGEEFINEVASISRTSHVNIVRLLGFCLDGSKRALIYDFMPNGSLEKFIFTDRSQIESTLGWNKLFEIVVGVARGLEYLHRGCNTRIVHFDIKPHNILLDQDFCPKISDFGLAKLCTSKECIISLIGARGTIGYIAPEVFSRNFGVVSSKSDVYSYGMMVLEMVGGRKNLDVTTTSSSETYFPHYLYKNINQYCVEACGDNGEATEIVRKMILVALWCIQTMPDDRPSMSRVVNMLEGDISDLQLPPKP